MAGGRPSVYDPAFCEQAIELGKLGKSLVQIACAFDVTRETIYAWMREKPEFSDAMTRAKAHSQAWWEEMGQAGLTMQGFNASLWAKNVSCRFREDYSEPKNVILSGDAANPVRTVNRVEIVAVEAKAPE
jgi:hypothetical protein